MVENFDYSVSPSCSYRQYFFYVFFGRNSGCGAGSQDAGKRRRPRRAEDAIETGQKCANQAIFRGDSGGSRGAGTGAFQPADDADIPAKDLL